ncbi:MAG TPA: HNH endonuclease [Gaiellaceae bacterium]|nr:HNH endonuclease [Gaiellaceae bacterium]
MLDEDVRTSCFLALAVLQAQFGDDLPYDPALKQGFSFRGTRVPFLNYQKGIYRAAVQRGPAALSIQTSAKSPYDDEETAGGFLYAYRAGDVNQPDNRALRAAHDLAVPIVYFVATKPGWYQALYPWWVTDDDPARQRVTLRPGKLAGPMDDPEPATIDNPIEREYAVRETRVRLHQGRFRGVVLPAYRNQCAICRLKEERLLDAAHIVADTEERGEPVVSNGLSLCTIHHRAFDQNLVGVSPDYEVRVARRLLDDEDGPMLEILKGSHGVTIELPRRRAAQPDRERLAVRFERFRNEASA